MHEENDPEEIELLSKIFDMRLWDINVTFEIENEKEEIENEIENLKKILKKLKIANWWRYSTCFARTWKDCGCESQKLTTLCADIQASPANNLFSVEVDAWICWIEGTQGLVEHHRKNNLHPKSETGCERAKSKYNLSKNRLSATMKLPMLIGRNRAGNKTTTD